MASTITAGNATNGLAVSSDNTGILELKTGTGSGTTAVTVGTGQNVTFAQAANLPNTFGFKNRIINGSMSIWQRATSATITAGSTITAGYSTVDRFYVYCTGANVTAARVTGSGSTQYRMQITGAASVTGIGFGQRIEQANSYDMAGSTAMLSVDLANSVLTTVTWTAFYANTADTFGTLASPTRTQIATGTFTVTSTVTNYSTSISIPAAATTGIEIVFTVGAQTSGTWTIGNVQLEKGSTATSFDYRPYGTELALCQRYYYKTYNVDVSPGTNTTVGGIIFETLADGTLTRLKAYNPRIAVNMRTTPTITIYSEGGTVNRISVYNNSASTLTVSSVANEGQTSFASYISTSTNAVAAQTYAGHVVASAEL